MAEFMVSTLNGIDFGATGTAEIIQNVQTILSTVMNSCPMHRDFAWIPPLDEPVAIQKAKTISRIVSAVKTFEPRAEVLQVEFQADDQNGRVIPTVRISISGGAT